MENVRVLICEDEALIALQLEHRLKDMGYDVAGIASGGVEAYELAEKFKPDLALMDIRLEGSLSGTEVADVLNKEFDIPSVYLTSHSDPETIATAGATKPIGFLTKPVQDRDLETTIKFGLAQHRAQRKLKEEIRQYNERLERAQNILTAFSASVAHGVRMDGLQDIVGGIAHYFNNSLAGILPSLEFLEECGTIPPFEMRRIRQIINLCNSQRLFVLRLLWASGRASFQLAPCSLREIIDEGKQKCGKPHFPGIEIKISYPENNHSLFVDKIALLRAFECILENAIEATGKSGFIHVELAESYEEIPERFNTSAHPGMYSVITVSDSGPGIPKAIISRVAEPFFTTHFDRLATGLGLTEAYGIVQGHLGWLDISSEEGKGTTVKMYIPQNGSGKGSQIERPTESNLEVSVESQNVTRSSKDSLESTKPSEKATTRTDVRSASRKYGYL